MGGMNRDMVIYHGGCVDGFGAAFACWRKLGDDVEYYAASHDDLPPNVYGKRLLFVDFCYKPEAMEALLIAGNDIHILDHHKSAMLAMAPLLKRAETNGGLTAVFDMNKSGARLAFDWANPRASHVPRLIRVIEEIDLWRFDLEDCKELFAYIESMPRDFTTWTQMAIDMEHNSEYTKMLHAGQALLRHADRECESLLKKRQKMWIGGYHVPVINAPYWHASTLGAALAREEGNAFGATYFDDEGGRKFSLRSVDSKADVSLIASMYAGGGHRNASGFSMPLGWSGDAPDKIKTES